MIRINVKLNIKGSQVEFICFNVLCLKMLNNRISYQNCEIVNLLLKHSLIKQIQHHRKKIFRLIKYIIQYISMHIKFFICLPTPLKICLHHDRNQPDGK